MKHLFRQKGCFIKVFLISNLVILFIFLLINNQSHWLKHVLDSDAPITKVKDVKKFSNWPRYWEPELIKIAEEMGIRPGMNVKPIRNEPLGKTAAANNSIDMTKYSYKDVLTFIPPVPKYTIEDKVYKIAKNITQKYLTLDSKEVYTQKIVILTPIHNSEGSLLNYAREINSFTYPHKLISVAFGEDSSHDNTLTMAHQVAEELLSFGFSRTNVFHFNITGQIKGSWNDIHHITAQYQRRKHLAEARNLLLTAGLKDEDYVLWIDSDIGSLQPDLIQQLLYAKKDIVTPVCLYLMGGITRVYDKNTWRETPLSLQDQQHMSERELVVEGYGPTSRLYLSDLRAEGRVVPIDGVGGCSLLVRAECHRKGLKFPEDVYKRHIETEGLAKMAKDMGFGVYGLPFVEVYHA